MLCCVNLGETSLSVGTGSYGYELQFSLAEAPRAVGFDCHGVAGTDRIAHKAFPARRLQDKDVTRLDLVILFWKFLPRAPEHWRILADLFGIAASGGIFVVPLYALLQTATEREHRARIIAANNVVNAAAMVAASAATIALLAGGLGIPGIFLLTGAATIAVAAACWWLLA